MSSFSIAAGQNIPNEFNVIIEIPAYSDSIKYEVDKDSGLLVVDRFMPVAMQYPCNYGFVPSTLAEDDDPVDVLVMTPEPIQAGAMITARAIGLLVMTDEKGKDSKILAVPAKKVCVEYENINSLEDCSEIFLKKINHFFERYKDLEPNKWVKVEGWENAQAAEKELMDSVERYQSNQ